MMLLRLRWVVMIVCLMCACEGGIPEMRAETPTPAIPSARAVAEQFLEAGLIRQITRPTPDPDSIAPQSYDEHLGFELVDLPERGQVLTCRSKKNCDALYDWFDLFSSLGGPYYYRSWDGKVVIQLNSGLSPDRAEQFYEIVKDWGR